MANIFRAWLEPREPGRYSVYVRASGDYTDYIVRSQDENELIRREITATHIKDLINQGILVFDKFGMTEQAVVINENFSTSLQRLRLVAI